MTERVGRIVEKKLERVGRIYPMELKVTKYGCESKVEVKEWDYWQGAQSKRAGELRLRDF
jgi:hypothetical protein